MGHITLSPDKHEHKAVVGSIFTVWRPEVLLRVFNYEVQTCQVGFDEAMATQIWASFVAWGSEYREITASEAMQAEATGGSGGRERAKAADFLKEQLCKGPRRVERLIKDAREGHGISERTLRRAAEDLNIRAYRPKGEKNYVGVAATR
jgi:hypothetical protein